MCEHTCGDRAGGEDIRGGIVGGRDGVTNVTSLDGILARAVGGGDSCKVKMSGGGCDQQLKNELTGDEEGSNEGRGEHVG